MSYISQNAALLIKDVMARLISSRVVFSSAIYPMIYFIIMMMLFPILIGPNASIFKTITPTIVWIVMTFTTLLCNDSIFKDLEHSGSLSFILLSPKSLPLQILALAVVNWLKFSLPQILLIPIVGYFCFLNGAEIGLLMLSLVIGTPSLVLLAIFGAAVFHGQGRAGFLMAMLIVPLYIPVLILGISSVQLLQYGQNTSASLALLLACFILMLVALPVATSSVLRSTYAHS